MSQDFSMSRGDTPTLTITITRAKNPVDLTGATLWMTAKNKLSDPDNQAVFQIQSPARIAITDAPGGIAKATLIAADTSSVAVKSALHYDVQLKEADNTITTVASGRLNVNVDATITDT